MILQGSTFLCYLISSTGDASRRADTGRIKYDLVADRLVAVDVRPCSEYQFRFLVVNPQLINSYNLNNIHFVIGLMMNFRILDIIHCCDLRKNCFDSFIL